MAGLRECWNRPVRSAGAIHLRLLTSRGPDSISAAITSEAQHRQGLGGPGLPAKGYGTAFRDDLPGQGKENLKPSQRMKGILKTYFTQVIFDRRFLNVVSKRGRPTMAETPNFLDLVNSKDVWKNSYRRLYKACYRGYEGMWWFMPTALIHFFDYCSFLCFSIGFTWSTVLLMLLKSCYSFIHYLKVAQGISLIR